MTDSYKFDIPKSHKSIIKVIGVGGGGSNAVNHMYNMGIKDVEFIVCNTDLQALQASPVPNKLQIGVNLTEGLGAGANPEVGRNAALESKEEIRELLGDNTKMVFITAGMGGGTGTGAAPVIAKVARELDILTVGIITLPFLFEGPKKMKAAEQGILELKQYCDTVIEILNDKLRDIYGNLPIRKAFSHADNILTTAAKSIAEVITVSSDINVDFEDVKTVMQGSGAAVMGSAVAKGENRALRAAEEAISSPLLNNRNIHGAQKILLSMASSENSELNMDELSDITEFIQEQAGADADMIFGHGIEPDLDEGIRVTVIATGFDYTDEGKKSVFKGKNVYDLESGQMHIFNQEDFKKQEKEENNTSDHNKKTETATKKKTIIDLEGEEKQEEDHLKELEKEFRFVDDENDEEHIRKEVVNGKKDALKRQAEERAKSLQNLRFQDMNDQELKEKWDVPAYQRRKITLRDTPQSDASPKVSKYNLNDDNQILGNNRFLHDNVD